MNAEMIAALKEIENERNISFDMLLEALEAALISAYKRNFGGEANAIVTIDRTTGEYKVYHRRNVVADGEVTDPKLEIAKKQAGSRYEPGDYYDEEVTPKDFGRIAAQTAKQVIVQRIREAERDTVFNTFSAKLHDIVLGVVQRYEQRNMFVTIDGKYEAFLPYGEQVPRENYRINDRIRAYVLDVRKTNKGPLVVLSRAAEGLVQRLLENAVPEIADNIVEIMAIAREAGSRSKVAVHSHRAEVDAVGACLGPKSSRIATVSDELRGRYASVHLERARTGEGHRRRALRGRTRRPRHRSRLPALARDRARRPERAPRGAPHRLAPRHHERNGSRGSPRALHGRTRRARSGARGRRRNARSHAGRGRRARSRCGNRRRGRRDGRGARSRSRIAPSSRRVQARDVRAAGERGGVIANPIRSCVGCRERRDQATLRRFTRVNGEWRPDEGRRADGRGAYLCSLACAQRVAKNKRFAGLSAAAVAALA
jgi:N utilization substance protein A